MELIYFGSSDFSVPFLEKLYGSSHKVKAVFTYGDRERGRGRRVSANPVKACAASRGIDVYEIDDFDDGFYRQLSGISFDYGVVISFGRIMPRELFDRWPGIWLNLHPSLLPQYRGPSPMISALLDGAESTGVSINSVVYEVDEGMLYAQAAFNIDKKDNLDRLEEKAVTFGAPLLAAVLDLIETRDYQPVPQAGKGVSYTRKITPDDLSIDWNKSAEDIFNRIRAFSTRPGAYTSFKGLRLKILASSLAGRDAGGREPGTVVETGKKSGIAVACGDDALLSLDLLQPQGKNPMDALSFINGYRIKSGTVLGKD